MANDCSNFAVLSVCNHASPVEGGTEGFTSGPESFIILQKEWTVTVQFAV